MIQLTIHGLELVCAFTSQREGGGSNYPVAKFLFGKCKMTALSNHKHPFPACRFAIPPEQNKIFYSMCAHMYVGMTAQANQD